MTFSRSDLRALRERLDRRAPGVQVIVTADRRKPDDLYLHLIQVPPTQRGYGLGQRVLDIVCQEADARATAISLTPSSDLGSDFRRLVRWYHRAGFDPVPGTQRMRRLARAL